MSATVYVVEEGAYESRSIVAVFATEAAAEAYIAQFGHEADDYGYSEHEVLAEPPKVVEVHSAGAAVDRDGQRRDQWARSYHYRADALPATHEGDYERGDPWAPSRYVWVAHAPTREQALESVERRIGEYLASRPGQAPPAEGG